MAFLKKCTFFSDFKAYIVVFKRLCLYSWANIIVYVCVYLMANVNMAFTGRLGTNKLDAVSLSNLMNNAVATSLFIGLSMVCEATMPQAISSGNPFRVGIILQKGIIIMLLASLLCAAMFVNLEHILVVLGQDPIISRYAGTHASVYIFGLPGHAMMILLIRYLICQCKILPVACCAISANVVGVFIHWLFIHHLNLDMAGSGGALALTRNALFLFLFIYIVMSGVYEYTWNGWSFECLYDWKGFLVLAIPCMLMLCLELWFAEFLAFVSGLLGRVQLASYSIVYTFCQTLFMVSVGISMSGAVMLGGYLGSGDIKMVQICIKVVCIAAALESVLVGCLTAALSGELPRIFVKDREVISMTAKVFLSFTPYIVASHMKEIAAGIIRGMGKVKYGAKCSFLSYYVVGLSIALPLALKTDLGVYGAVIGLTVGTLFQLVLLVTKICTSDWQQEIDSTIERSKILPSKTDTKNTKDGDEKTHLTKETKLLENRDVESEKGYHHLDQSSGDDVIQQKSSDGVHESHCHVVCVRVTIILLCVAVLIVGIATRFHMDGRRAQSANGQ